MKNRFTMIAVATAISATLMLAGFTASAAEENLVEVCKQDCPKAKTDEEAHKCAEKKGRLNKEFRKSKCWEVNEEYEKKASAKEEK